MVSFLEQIFTSVIVQNKAFTAAEDNQACLSCGKKPHKYMRGILTSSFFLLSFHPRFQNK